MDKRAREIRTEVLRRGIEQLVHFTHICNLRSIVSHGLLSRADLIERDIDAIASDSCRYDNELGAVSLSITQINRDMFSSKLKSSKSNEWVVLLFDPSILWTHHCRFCSRNAAHGSMIGRNGLSGPWAFRQMFSNDTAHPYLTARNDAEVQVFGAISSDKIIGAWVESRSLAEFVQIELNQLEGQERDVCIR